jgi:hypothetical protein
MSEKIWETLGDYEKSQAGFMENVYIVHWNLGEIWEMCIYIPIYIYTHQICGYTYIHIETMGKY